jgi:hypothetical protein
VLVFNEPFRIQHLYLRLVQLRQLKLFLAVYRASQKLSKKNLKKPNLISVVPVFQWLVAVVRVMQSIAITRP